MEDDKSAKETQEKTPAEAAPENEKSREAVAPAADSKPENSADSAGENSANSAAPDAVPEKKECPHVRIFKRVLKIVLAIVILLILAAVIVGGFFLGPIVRAGVNAFGASILGVDKCSIGAAKIYPFVGYARFEKIFIGKPIAADCEFSRDVLDLEFVEIDADVFSLLSRKKTLERFELRNVTANYEQLLNGKTNIEVLVDNALGEGAFAELTSGENAADNAGTAENADAGTADEAEEEMLVAAHYFVIENANAGASVRGAPVVLPSFSSDFSNGIGVDEDLTSGDFVKKIAGDYLDVLRLSALGGAVSDAAGATVDAASDAAGATVDAVGDAAGAATDAVSGAAGAVLDMLGGDSGDDKK